MPVFNSSLKTKQLLRTSSSAIRGKTTLNITRGIFVFLNSHAIALCILALRMKKSVEKIEADITIGEYQALKSTTITVRVAMSTNIPIVHVVLAFWLALIRNQVAAWGISLGFILLLGDIFVVSYFLKAVLPTPNFGACYSDVRESLPSTIILAQDAEALCQATGPMYVLSLLGVCTTPSTSCGFYFSSIMFVTKIKQSRKSNHLPTTTLNHFHGESAADSCSVDAVKMVDLPVLDKCESQVANEV
ncbi:hypothetical protein CVT26_009027 [Gymnopilus dilepis]|uniref:Uncharacterized protein n=1 Tax=Gymnopilus dilepis TaxID=231916 RepID=A0A409YB83_9AGAR|nr:hypothetical protein CVT26_009027 [Gymnopilus dilepis]